MYLFKVCVLSIAQIAQRGVEITEMQMIVYLKILLTVNIKKL